MLTKIENISLTTPRWCNYPALTHLAPLTLAAAAAGKTPVQKPRPSGFSLARNTSNFIVSTTIKVVLFNPFTTVTVKMADQPGATPTAMIIGTAIISIATGYMLGMASSLGFLPNPFAGPKAPRQRGDTSHYNDEEESSEEEIDDGVIIDHAPNWANGVEADKRDGLRASALKKRVAKENGMETPKAVVAPGTRRDETVKEKRRRQLKEAEIECAQRGWDVNGDFKMVFVIRRDIGISIGKLLHSSFYRPESPAKVSQARQQHNAATPQTLASKPPTPPLHQTQPSHSGAKSALRRLLLHRKPSHRSPTTQKCARID